MRRGRLLIRLFTVVTLAALLFAGVSASGETKIPTGKVYWSGHAYQLISAASANVKTWEEALDYCKSKGGHLAIISSEYEDNFVHTMIKYMDRDLYRVFIGYSDRIQEGNWMWVDGEDSHNAYSNWAPGEPNDEYGEPYAAIWTDTGKWNDTKFRASDYEPAAHNTYLTYFICEWD